MMAIGMLIVVVVAIVFLVGLWVCFTVLCSTVVLGMSATIRRWNMMKLRGVTDTKTPAQKTQDSRTNTPGPGGTKEHEIPPDHEKDNPQCQCSYCEHILALHKHYGPPNPIADLPSPPDPPWLRSRASRREQRDPEPEE